MHQSIRLAAVTAVCALAGLAATGTPALAQLYNPCPYTNDGDCDEPNGLGLCAWGTDTADCSNPNSNFGYGSGYGSSAGGSTSGGGTSSGGLYNPCPYTNDGDCDEPNGLGYCAWGTDTADCSNPNSNYGTGSGYSGHGGSTAGGGGTTGGGGGGGGAISTYSPWRRITNDQRQYAAQPGGALPLNVSGGMYFQPGNYVVYYGLVQGGQIYDIRNSAVTLMPNERYLASASSSGWVNFNTDPRLAVYQPPAPGHAMIYARNDDIANERAICVLPAGWPMSYCSQ